MQNIFIYLAIACIMLQAGCGTMVQHEESTRPFGSSVRLAVQQQIYNPEAGTDAPVVGLDGRYAAEVATTYQEGPRTEASDGMSISEGIIN
ncbi:MAG: hypothetical protein OCC46_09360 [Pseudodesulfovibrio sp.]